MLEGVSILSCDSLVTNGEKETSSVTEILLKTRASKCLCRRMWNMSRLLGHRKAALYCFYFHQKCPERPERYLYIYLYLSIYIYIYIYVNNMADVKSIHNLSAMF